MLAQSTSWNFRIASITANGFCAVAALSKYTSGLPWIFCLRTGKSSRIFSTSNPIASMLRAVLMKFLEENFFQLLLQRRNFDPVEDVLRERIRQQAPRLAAPDAARLQIEQRFVVQLSDGRAVRAAHIIGENLQFGLGIDHRVVR